MGFFCLYPRPSWANHSNPMQNQGMTSCMSHMLCPPEHLRPQCRRPMLGNPPSPKPAHGNFSSKPQEAMEVITTHHNSAQICIHIHTRMHICSYVCVRACVHEFAQVCMYTHAYTCVHTHIHTYVRYMLAYRVHLPIPICVYVCISTKHTLIVRLLSKVGSLRMQCGVVMMHMKAYTFWDLMFL